MFGHFQFYDSVWLAEACSSLQLEQVLGLRTVFGLSQNSQIKFEPKWQEAMFSLEMLLSEDKQAKEVAFFQHLILRKGLLH